MLLDKTGAPTSMTPEEFQSLNDYITERFGLSFPESKQEMLTARLARRLEELRLKTYMDYYWLLQFHADGELRELTRKITNNETYFFRETHQFDLLFQDGLNILKRDFAIPGRLRILCAGCSSGEEPYTLNIYCQENQCRMWDIETHIDAFDLEAHRVEMARIAEYGASSLRCASVEQVCRYFSPIGHDRYQLKPRFQKGVGFFEGNIVDLQTYAPVSLYDVVFCRNVLIYFSEPALHRAIANFAQVLRPGGLLFLGHSESIIGLSPLFTAIRIGDYIVYQRASS